MYRTATKILKLFFTDAQIYKHGFNISPMYRRSTGRVIYASPDLHIVKVQIPLSYKNRNYVGSIFGGSLFSATDPIYMIQLIQILGDEYVVWDKAATIKYKRPAKQAAYATFEFISEEITKLKNDVAEQGEIDLVKEVNITSKDEVVFAEVIKTIYVSSKAFYKEKLKTKKPNHYQ